MPRPAHLMACLIFTAIAFVYPVLGSSAHAQDLRLRANQDGEALYERYCALCHGMDAKGRGVMASRLIRPPSDLTTLSVRHDGIFPQDYVLRHMDGRADVAEHGPREMPIWGERFENNEKEAGGSSVLFAIADYLKSIQISDDN